MRVPATGDMLLNEIGAEMLRTLPEDGTPVLNRVMRALLAQRLECVVDDDLFLQARGALLAQGKVGRLRGQGGQTFLTQPGPPAVTGGATPAEAAVVWSESALMQPLRDFLSGPFRTSLDLPPDGACIIQDTSVMTGQKGKWARPDFILVSAMRFRLMPGAQVDLHSFELKTEAGGSVLAIHEALAQTRFTHFGHFVWHLPAGSNREAMLNDIIKHCGEHGIGLIRIRDPSRPTEPGGCEVLVDPRRKPTLNSIVDDFLETKLSAEQKATLRRAISEAV